uniref:Uncharacterized protein n=1 Tax=Solanum tuberosum TaxID=4113 RepID=M1DM35_SOLTU
MCLPRNKVIKEIRNVKLKSSDLGVKFGSYKPFWKGAPLGYRDVQCITTKKRKWGQPCAAATGTKLRGTSEEGDKANSVRFLHTDAATAFRLIDGNCEDVVR